jgi:hypothetical protein
MGEVGLSRTRSLTGEHAGAREWCGGVRAAPLRCGPPKAPAQSDPTACSGYRQHIRRGDQSMASSGIVESADAREYGTIVRSDRRIEQVTLAQPICASNPLFPQWTNALVGRRPRVQSSPWAPARDGVPAELDSRGFHKLRTHGSGRVLPAP